MNHNEWKFFNWFKSTTGMDLVPQPCQFKLPGGLGSYTPDFFCEESSTYYEVVGTRSAYYSGRRKYEAMGAKSGVQLCLVNPDGSMFKIPARNRTTRKLHPSIPLPKPIEFPAPKETCCTYHEDGKYVARFERNGQPFLVFKTSDFSHLVTFLAINEPEVA